MTFRRLAPFAVLAVALTLALTGCGNKTATNTGTVASDSTLASNPVEQSQGQIQPQAGAQAGGTQQQTAPTTESGSTPAPEHPHHSTTHRASSGSSGGEAVQAQAPAEPAGVTVPAGTTLKVTLGAAITSETAQPGQSWSGTLKEAITVGTAAPFPAGSTVMGVVDGATPAAKGGRALLLLRVTSIQVNGTSHDISASADSMVAGSTRKRNVGAIAGGAAAGALLGKALGGGGKGAVIGGLLGAGAATGAVAASKGFQVTVAQGQDIDFHVDHDTHVRL
ncbi:MAG TPA: hypothetical protein VMH61_07325 [Candidatus Acidoferrales bacterium]|nr:hypothetical protein [Candidatus Acidoferrales bacterium]